MGDRDLWAAAAAEAKGTGGDSALWAAAQQEAAAPAVAPSYANNMGRSPGIERNNLAGGIKTWMHSGPEQGRYFPDRGGRPIDLVPNFFKGIAQTGQGTGIMVGGPMSRAAQAIMPQRPAKLDFPTMIEDAAVNSVGNILAPGLPTLLHGNKSAGTLPMLRPGDWDKAKELGGAMYKEMNQNLFKPIYRGFIKQDQNSPHERAEFGQRLLEDPFGYAMQVPALWEVGGGALSLGSKGALAAGRRVAPALTGKIEQNVAQAGQAAGRILDRAPILGNQRLNRHVRSVRDQHAQQILSDAKSIEDELTSAWEPIPDKRHVVPGLEWSDDAAAKYMADDPAAAAFQKLANSRTRSAERRLVADNDLTPEDAMIARWGESLRDKFPTDADLRTPAGRKALKEAEFYAGVYGNSTPTYVPRISPKANQTFFEQLQGNPFGRAADTNSPEWLSARVGKRQDMHSTRADKVIAQRLIEERQLQGTRQFLSALINDPRLQAARRPGWKPANQVLNDFEARVASAAGVGPDRIAAIRSRVGPEITLPPNVLKSIEQLARHADQPDILSTLANHYKYMLLAPDVAFPARQFAQNQMIAAGAMWRGPNDALESTLAYGLTLSGDAKKILPGDLTYGGATGKAIAEGVGEPPANLAGKVISGSKKLLDKNLEMVSKGDTFHRELAGSYFALREAKDLMGRAKNLEEASRNVSAVMANPVLRARVYHEVNKWFGRYDQMTRAERRAISKHLPFWDWQMHALSLATAFYTETPWKNFLHQHFTEVAPGVFQPKDMPDFYKRVGAVPVQDENGKPMYVTRNGKQIPVYMMKPQFSPLSQTLESGAQIYAGLAGREGAGGELVTPPINPLYSAGIMAAGTNPSTLRPYVNPADPSNSSTHFDSKGKPVTYNSPGVGIPAAAMYPRMYQFAQQLYDYPYKSSPLTVPGINHAVARSGKDKKPLEGKTPQDMAATALGLGYTYPTVTRTDERKIEQINKKKYQNAMQRQRAGLAQQPDTAMKGLDDMARFFGQ